jgi:hypothetical protein
MVGGGTFAVSVGLALALFMGGCGQSPPATAKATLVNSQGQKVGEATLTQTPEGVNIVMKVENLPPGEQARAPRLQAPILRSGFIVLLSAPLRGLPGKTSQPRW